MPSPWEWAGKPATLQSRATDEKGRVQPPRRVWVAQFAPDIRFHNNAPLTSADVVWSFRRYLDPDTRWRCHGEFTGRGYAKILSVQTAGPLAVRIILDRAAPTFLQTLARTDCGGTAILHRSSVGADVTSTPREGRGSGGK